MGLEEGIFRSCTVAPRGAEHRAWVSSALAKLDEEERKCPPTPLCELRFSARPQLRLVLKDESASPSGSLKHRLARSLMRRMIVDGRIGEATRLYDVSSGNTAISTSHFARLLGLSYTAVVPFGTTSGKLDAIRVAGGEVLEVDADETRKAALDLAARHEGCFLDQFTNAERAYLAPDAGSLAPELFGQLAQIGLDRPDWIVVGAGTGGTSTSIGRHLLAHAGAFPDTGLCVADPENSAFFEAYSTERGQRPPSRQDVYSVCFRAPPTL